MGVVDHEFVSRDAAFFPLVSFFFFFFYASHDIDMDLCRFWTEFVTVG